MNAPPFGLLLNCGGEVEGRSHDAVFALALAHAGLAERLRDRDVWVTEHHSIPFGVNPSALALASFLLGVRAACGWAPPSLSRRSTNRSSSPSRRHCYCAAAERAGRDAEGVSHVHALITCVTDDESAARERLGGNLLRSFAAGDHPHGPQAGDRHVGPDGCPLDRGKLAAFAAKGALESSPAQLAEAFAQLRDQHGVRRFVLYMEPIGEPAPVLESVERFAKEVAPLLGERGGEA
jgi:alkanesulfonate monooxygenase SsuD/methylene tetrahydromethanopterin reductase-like flavin-dependent oxidoreductase (luciferase family)